MTDWNRIQPGQSGVVKIWADGTVAVPYSIATSFMDPVNDRAAVYHNNESIALRAGADPNTTFSVAVNGTSSRVEIKAKSAILSAVGGLPDSSTPVSHDIVDAEIGVVLKLDMSEVLDNDV
jgi:hypothetical protein